MKKVVLVVIITNRVITVTPVSYTHLDVYKRQLYRFLFVKVIRLCRCSKWNQYAYALGIYVTAKFC